MKWVWSLGGVVLRGCGQVVGVVCLVWKSWQLCILMLTLVRVEQYSKRRFAFRLSQSGIPPPHPNFNTAVTNNMTIRTFIFLSYFVSSLLR